MQIAYNCVLRVHMHVHVYCVIHGCVLSFKRIAIILGCRNQNRSYDIALYHSCSGDQTSCEAQAGAVAADQGALPQEQAAAAG